MAKHLQTGNLGEYIAIKYLEMNSYTILKKNWFFRHKEIDIIAQKDNEIIFIEVKTRHDYEHDSALSSLTAKKQRNIIDGANYYIDQNEIDLECRFDIIIVLITHNDFEIEHFKNAIYPE